MSITQTYFLAHTARGKLSSEAARSDHDLRLLVGHANLLDSLTVDLQEAEREQDAWFERTVAEARKPTESKRVQWTDRASTVSVRDLEIPDAEDDDSDADSDASSDDEDDEAVYAEANAVTMMVAPRRAKSPPPMIMDADSESEDDEEDEDEDMYDDEMDNAALSLTRVQSRSSFASISPPPDLVHDHSDEEEESESESEEELSSPIAPILPIQPVIAPKDLAHPSSQAHGFLDRREPALVSAY